MLLGSVYPPDIRVEKEVRALVDADHEVFVLSYATVGRPERETIDGADVIRRPIDETTTGVGGWAPGLRYLVTYVHEGWARATSEVVEAEDIDVLHVHDLPPVKTAIQVGEKYDVPVVADLHENWPEAKRQYRSDDVGQYVENPKLVLAHTLKSVWRLKRFERYCVQRADRTIAVVEEGRAHYVRDCGASPEAAHVISNVVDLGVFDDAEISPVGYEEEFVISYVGTLSGEHRGLDAVIEAMLAIGERVPDARLLIVGPESRYGRTLERLVTDRDVTDRVTFVGRVPFERVPSYIAASDVCLVPHRANPHTATTVPHKLFQYMAMEKPVLVTDIAPVARIVRETNAGHIVPADDGEVMAAAIVELARHPERMAELGANGRKAVEERYNWEIEAEELRALYRSLRTRSNTTREDSRSERRRRRRNLKERLVDR
jgi:glycosyltransferase involved in cell wall biosynthesis